MDAILKKVLAFLEGYVEWLAVALAAAFFGWMLYDYVILKPVTATVANQQLSPGEVDPKVLAGPAQQLQADMASQVVPSQLRAPEDFVADLQRRLDPPMNATAFAAWYFGLPVPGGAEPPPERHPQENGNPVTQLPTVPAPEDLKIEQGRSNVQVPPAPAAAASAGGNASPLVQLTGNDVQPSDRNWVSISAMIRVKPLADQLNATKIPASLKRISILRLELIRQEQDANGNWVSSSGAASGEDVIGPFPTVNLPPLPAADAQPVEQVAYVQWAEKQDAQQALLQPPFYTVLQADPWVVPGLPQGQAVGQLTNLSFDPATYTGDRDDLPPDEQKMLDDYRKAQAAAKAAAAKQRAAEAASRSASRGGLPGGLGGPPGGGGPGGGGGGRPAPDDPDRPLTLAQAGGFGGGYPGGFGGPPGFRGGPPGFFGRPPGFPPQAGLPQQQAPVDDGNPRNTPQATLPPGAFDPNPPKTDIVVWAHDDTVAPGKTYRYKLRYLIKNPVFQTTNVAQPQALAQQFEIVSKDSDWTDPLSVKAETNLFAVSTSPQRNNVPVRFDIFRWKSGAWQRQSVEVEPGDVIGSVDSTTQTDFSTGLTLVDVHPDPRNIDDRIITLTTDSGQMLQHDLTADRNNPDHKKLNADVNSQPKPTAPGTGAAGTAGGASAGPPGAPRPGDAAQSRDQDRNSP